MSGETEASGSATLLNTGKELRVVLEKINGLESPSPSPAKRSKVLPPESTVKTEKIVEMKPDVVIRRKPEEIVGRKDQCKLLKALFGNKTTTMPRCVFLWGAPSSGKSYTLEGALEGQELHVVRIHCAEILCGRRAFYETLVKQLISPTSPLAPNFKCDSLHSLYSNFDSFLRLKKETSTMRVVVVVEGAENLRGEYDDILRFLVSLQDIVQTNLCVIFTSTLPPGLYMPTIMDHSIIPMYFPQYTMEELTQILIQQKVHHNGTLVSNYYDFYVKMIVSMFYYACRDLRKLLRLTKSHWDKFQEMAANSEEVNLSRLWKKLEPQLKAQFFELNSSLGSVNLSDNSKEPEISGRALEMPQNAKYLLIASYLATHNPPASDKRFFVKTKSAKSRKGRQPLAKTDIKPTVRSFELNRLNAIFSSIQVYCDDKTVNKNRNISFMTLLTTLCQNKVIQHLGEDTFGNQKYKCLLDYDTILEVSRSVNFELNNYLFRLI